jgi:UDP-3-O-[3-hydroxymyristoyl] glucosamine N-acyltransferase
MPFTVATLCAQLGVPVPHHGAEVELHAIRALGEATAADLSFLENSAYKQAAQTTKAGAVLVRAADAPLLPAGCTAIVVAQPYVAYARALALFYPAPPLAPGVSQFAVVSARAEIHPSARIEPYAVVYAGARVGAGAHIGAHVVVGENVVIGGETVVGAHATLQKCQIGPRCKIHPGVSIGQDGFGFAQGLTPQGEPELVKIPHIGGVTIGADVEIGANTTIDAGALANTIIEDMVKLDKQVQIAHNVTIGYATRIAAQSAVAGSTKIGAWCVIGGKVGVAGHLEIAPKCMVAAMSGVTKSISAPGSVVSGMPAVPITQWRQQMAILARLSRNMVQKIPESMTTPEPETSVASGPVSGKGAKAEAKRRSAPPQHPQAHTPQDVGKSMENKEKSAIRQVEAAANPFVGLTEEIV